MNEQDPLWQQLDLPGAPESPPALETLEPPLVRARRGIDLEPDWRLVMEELPRSRAGVLAVLAVVAGVSGGLFGSRTLLADEHLLPPESLEESWWGPMPGSLSWEYLQEDEPQARSEDNL